MSDRVIVTSGLSKAYGIPGVRIGWIVGPPSRGRMLEPARLHHHRPQQDLRRRGAHRRAAGKREKLYARTRAILQHNLPLMREWPPFLRLSDLSRTPGGRPVPDALSIATPSFELSEHIRVNQAC